MTDYDHETDGCCGAYDSEVCDCACNNDCNIFTCSGMK